MGGRAVLPKIRVNGELQEASWEEAMSLVAENFSRSIQANGADSVAFYGSGQLFCEESYTANKPFKAGVGTNNVDGNPIMHGFGCCRVGVVYKVNAEY